MVSAGPKAGREYIVWGLDRCEVQRHVARRAIGYPATPWRFFVFLPVLVHGRPACVLPRLLAPRVPVEAPRRGVHLSRRARFPGVFHRGGNPPAERTTIIALTR